MIQENITNESKIRRREGSRIADDHSTTSSNSDPHQNTTGRGGMYLYVCGVAGGGVFKLVPSGHMTFIQRCIDVEATLYLRHVPAGLHSIESSPLILMQLEITNMFSARIASSTLSVKHKNHKNAMK